MNRMILVVLLALFPSLAFSGPLANPIVFVGCHAPQNGHKENTSNNALSDPINLTRFDPDANKNGVLDILENLGIPGYD